MPKSAASCAPEAISERKRNSKAMVRSALPVTDVLVTAACWQAEPDAEAVVLRAIAAAAETVEPDVGEAELAVMLTDDAGIRTLNANWRGIDKPTNVLSFPAAKSKAGAKFLGDIVIAYETLRRECDDEARTFLHHLAHLTVHGFLHLVGYDHQAETQAEEMEGIESKIMRSMKMPDPYPARDLNDVGDA